MLCYLITMIFDPLLSLRLLAQSRALFRISVEIELGLDLLSHADGRITFVQTAHLSAGKRFRIRRVLHNTSISTSNDLKPRPETQKLLQSLRLF